MNLLSNLSKEFQSYIKFFTSNRKLLWSERFYIWKSDRRLSWDGIIDMEDLYQIIGHVNEEHLKMNPSNIEKHPEIPNPIWRKVQKNPDLKKDAYICLVEEKIREHGMEKYITIEKNIYGVLIAETDLYYHTKYKITIKNLVINAHAYQKKMYFYPLPLSDYGPEGAGVYLIFKNNYFFPSKGNHGFVSFFSKIKTYLIFENNNFKFTSLFLDAENSSKIELTGNIFEEGHMIIKSTSDNSDKEQSNILCLENNILYSDIRSSRLKLNGDKCYFKGKNTIDNLIMSTDGYVYWSGYQNIDPQGKHAHKHKEMFIKLKTKAIQNNDKMQEIILHRELLKCDKALIREEKTVRSLQDGFIMWWSGWISDYGVSWFRPVRLLIYINALLAFIVFHFFDISYSWWFLFAEFFNPLSSLADVTMIKDSGLISSINILQKAVLAIFIYEIIKIFRRFSK